MTSATVPARAGSIELDQQPGHLIRRLHQISVGIFLAELDALSLTPIQFAALQAVSDSPDSDQKRLARTIALDASTTGGVVDRLQARELIERHPDEHDRRVRLLRITAAGSGLLQRARPRVLAVQERILAPLSRQQRQSFMHLLEILVSENNAHSRAPAAPLA